MHNELSIRLKKYRINAGISEEDFASRLGIRRSLAEDWEKGKANPDGNMLYAIAALYDVSLDQLLNLDPDEVIRDDGSTASPLPSPENAAKADVSFVKRDRKVRLFRYIAFTLITAAVYVALGLALGLWHPLWVLFMAIPVEVSLFDVFEYRNIRKLNFPVLVAFIYVLFGCLFGWWHPSWLVFVTVPLFYVIF